MSYLVHSVGLLCSWIYSTVLCSWIYSTVLDFTVPRDKKKHQSIQNEEISFKSTRYASPLPDYRIAGS